MWCWSGWVWWGIKPARFTAGLDQQELGQTQSEMGLDDSSGQHMLW